MLVEVMPSVIEHIAPDVRQDNVSVCNNAAWCAGEIALKQGAGMATYVAPLMERLVPLLLNTKAQRSLTENAAVTIGRLALVCPESAAPHLSVFIKNWCDALAEIKDNEEKDSAFRGICLAIQTNPAGVAEHFGSFLHALVRWRTPSEELSQMFRSVSKGISLSYRIILAKTDRVHPRSCFTRIDSGSARRLRVPAPFSYPFPRQT